MSSLFPLTSRLKEAVLIINSLEESILTRVIQRICEEYENSERFSANQIIKLKETLCLDDTKLNIVLAALSYIIQQATYHLIKPSTLNVHLKELGFNDIAATTISEVWSLNAKRIIDFYKNKSVIPDKVDSVESSLHLVLSSHTGGPTKSPIGLIHFNINSSEKSTLTVEFTKEELLTFYHTLEQIQSDLDQIV